MRHGTEFGGCSDAMKLPLFKPPNTEPKVLHYFQKNSVMDFIREVVFFLELAF